MLATAVVTSGFLEVAKLEPPEDLWFGEYAQFSSARLGGNCLVVPRDSAARRGYTQSYFGKAVGKHPKASYILAMREREGQS